MYKIIINANEILQIKDTGSPRFGKDMRELNILKNSSIIIRDQKIHDIIPQEQALLEYEGAEIIDANNKVVMPGFCDSHTHLVFAGSREKEFNMRLEGATYMEIMEAGGGIQNTVNATRNISEQDLYNISEKRLFDTFKYGTTSIEIKSGYGLDKDTELKQLRVIKKLKNINQDIKSTFMGAHSLPPEFSDNMKFLEFLNNEVLPEVIKGDYADFIDIFCEKGVFTPEEALFHLKKGKESGLIPKIHADELAKSQACEVGAKVGAISADHLLKASDAGLSMMAENNVIATLLPATLFNLASKEYQNARYMIDEKNLAVALATDFNPGSCYCENMFITLHIACQYLKMTPAEVLIASTLNGAYAMNLNEGCGSLDKGKNADILIIDAPNHMHIPYHFGINPIYTTIKRGKIVYKSE